mgnify:CR=1 FL=1|tara:strand:+ start:278 stop:529 length:252 start_codon:yes stop_codon:yes gene_type:complete
MKSRLSKTIKRLEKLNILEKSSEEKVGKGLNAIEVKVFRQLRDKYDLSLESNQNSEKKSDNEELSQNAKLTLERINKGESFKV